ncbi:C2 domain-containing protein [Pilobolus umbonatus]|nr:C2 domain-containing protein [Pilobolus umbonatus]
MSHIPIIGELVVVALKAALNKQDPFCVFRVGDIIKRTKADPGGGLNPIWDDQVNIPILQGQRQLMMQIFNRDNNLQNLMAEGHLDLSTVFRDREFDGYFPLTYRGHPGFGEILLELTFYPAVQ